MVPFLFFILVGILQGALEWLPVSSEGQILLVGQLFDITDEVLFSLAFWLHFGTMASVLYYYKEEWKQILNFKNTEMHAMRMFLVYTTIGTAIIGVPIRLLLLAALNLQNYANLIMWIIAIALIITGGLIWYSRRQTTNERSIEELSTLFMLGVGGAQGLAIIPGISRSGVTVSALLLMRTNPEESFRGSFYMSVPAVLGAIVLDLFDVISGESQGIFELNLFYVAISILLSFVFGLMTMRFLLEIARRYNFAIVVIILGLLIIVGLIIISV